MDPQYISTHVEEILSRLDKAFILLRNHPIVRDRATDIHSQRSFLEILNSVQPQNTNELYISALFRSMAYSNRRNFISSTFSMHQACVNLLIDSYHVCAVLKLEHLRLVSDRGVYYFTTNYRNPYPRRRNGSIGPARGGGGQLTMRPPSQKESRLQQIDSSRPAADSAAGPTTRPPTLYAKSYRDAIAQALPRTIPTNEHENATRTMPDIIPETALVGPEQPAETAPVGPEQPAPVGPKQPAETAPVGPEQPDEAVPPVGRHPEDGMVVLSKDSIHTPPPEQTYEGFRPIRLPPLRLDSDEESSEEREIGSWADEPYGGTE